MRMTIQIDESLFLQAKKEADRSGRTVTAIVEEALRDMLEQQEQSDERSYVHLPVVHGNGLQPGVDLDDSSALLDLMTVADDSG